MHVLIIIASQIVRKKIRASIAHGLDVLYSSRDDDFVLEVLVVEMEPYF